ncbi:MAG: tetratricopeptide repeat protein [Acidobacteriota bacterium]|nr:tetratricopeptide repeat protein [Acidobacteriota bacterium]
MVKVLRKFGFWFLAFGCLSVSGAAAQDLGDLGSSSKIFRAPNPKTTKKADPAPKTPAPKKRAVTPKPETAKTPPKPSRNAANTTANTTAAKTPKPKAKTPETKNTIAKTNQNRSQQQRQAKNQAIKTPAKQSKPTPDNVVINIGRKTPETVDDKLEDAIESGNLARDERDYDAAEKAYRSAQSIRPRDSRAVYGLGNIFSDQQRWEDAEKAYRQAITLEPESPEAHIALSFVLTQPVSGVNLSERYAEAEKTARRAIELDPNNAVAYDQLGVSLELSGKIGIETEQAYRNAIRLDPEFALAYAHLGRLLRRNGLNNDSALAYRDAIRLAADVPTMILIAEVMQSQQRYAESEQLLRRAVREDPKNPTALYLLGRALTTSGNFDEAESLLKRSISVSPNSFIAYAQLASLHARRGNYAEAERTLMKSLKVVSVNERKQLALEFETIGDGFLRKGLKTDAARVYRQAIMLDNEKKDLVNKLTEAQKS